MSNTQLLRINGCDPHKTLRCRLDTIEELTGLDLDRHPDRIRTSIALELLHLADVPPSR